MECQQPTLSAEPVANIQSCRQLNATLLTSA